tara:strand:+ start:171 stop:974 length:804 start_codon:yes stop_codon:yes gene_type:complete
MNRRIVIPALFLSLLIIPLLVLPGPSGGLNEPNIQQIETASADSDFCFAVAGDLHSRWDILDWFIDEVESEDYPFFILNGDSVQWGTHPEYQQLAKHLSTSEIPFVAIKGNHEIQNGDDGFYEDFFSEQTHFSFNYGNNKFIVLDTSSYSLPAAQRFWLEEELATDDKTFVITHIPLFSKGEWGHIVGGEEVEKVLLENLPELFITSHVHRPDNYVKDGIRYLVTPTLGGKLSSEEYFYGYNEICVSEKGYEIFLIKAPSHFQKWYS